MTTTIPRGHDTYDELHDAMDRIRAMCAPLTPHLFSRPAEPGDVDQTPTTSSPRTEDMVAEVIRQFAAAPKP